MKRIGLVTWLGGGNYGTSLQAYALYKFLLKQGYDVSLINYFNFQHFGLKPKIKALLKWTGIIRLREVCRIVKMHDTLKYRKLFRFLRENIKQTYVFNNHQYKELLQNSDVFCVGSDQVWNAYYNFNPFNFLHFAQDAKRISYASSIGTTDFPKQYQEEIKVLLSKFEHISLREETGRKAVMELIARDDIETVLDPTFLLTSSEWEEVAKNAKFEMELPRKYILCYLIGNNEHYKRQVEEVKKLSSTKDVIVIPAEENPNFKIQGATEYRFASVPEFIWLLIHAETVVTDSFHATAICINLQKNFIEFLRFGDSEKVSQNSRIYDVLKTFGLEERLYVDTNVNWKESIDFSSPSEILERLRIKSINWLSNAIEN
jgi:hypothetical protein